MQMADWLDKNHLSMSEVAKAWGMAPIVLQRHVRGIRWPSREVMVRCYMISNGEVNLSDWIETCRPLLERDGVIERGWTDGAARTKAKRQARTGGGGREGTEGPEPDAPA